MHYAGRRDRLPPLVALQMGTGRLALQYAPARVQRDMHNYCGSVAFDDHGRTFAASSPRGGIAIRWSVDGAFLESHTQEDVRGISSTPGGFWFSDGLGRLHAASSETLGQSGGRSKIRPGTTT